MSAWGCTASAESCRAVGTGGATDVVPAAGGGSVSAQTAATTAGSPLTRSPIRSVIGTGISNLNDVRAHVGLGSNLGDREATLREAVRLLEAEPGIEVVAVSSVRETDPVGYLDQPPFLNGACAIETLLAPAELLARLLAIEARLGRVREGGPRWGPRACDLDLLLYGNRVVEEPGLVVPHPRLTERRFALEPLVELDPELTLPDGRRLAGILAGL